MSIASKLAYFARLENDGLTPYEIEKEIESQIRTIDDLKELAEWREACNQRAYFHYDMNQSYQDEIDRINEQINWLID